jgi:hypothetical protein
MLQGFLGSLLGALSKPQVQDKIISYLRNRVIENFIVNVLKLSGFKYWIVSLLADRVIEESDEHIIEPIFREIGFASDQLKGAKIYKKVKDAKDLDEWLNAIGDV